MAGRKVLSIEIGVQTTRMVEIDYKKAKPHVYNCVSFETPDGAVEDGFIRNREILSVAMKEAMVNSGIRNTNVVFTMSSTKIANREVVIPLVPDNKIKGVVDSNAKEYFPVDIDQYVVTYSILERLKAEKNLRLLVLAAPNQLIESYYEFARMMSFDIVALDYVGNSSLQILKSQIGTSGTTLSVQLNESNTLINISKGDALFLQRTVPYGTAAIVDATLNSGAFELSDRKEAWDKLTSTTIINAKLDESGIDDAALSYMESNDDSYAQQLKVMKAKEDITDTLSYLINNVIRVIDYYTAKFPDNRIDKINLCGPGSRISGIDVLFRNEMFIEVETMDNLYGIEFERAVMIDNADKCLYMSVVGAAIAPVDFIPQEHQIIAKKKNNNKQMMTAFAACVGISLLFVIVGCGRYIILKSEKSNKETQAKELEQYENLYNQYNDVHADLNNVKGLYTSTLNSASMFNVFITEFEQNFLAGSVKVNEISLNDATCSVFISCGNEEQAMAIIQGLKNMKTVKSVDSWGFTKNTQTTDEDNKATKDNKATTDSAYISDTSTITFTVDLTFSTDFPYEKIAELISEGKDFNTAVYEASKDLVNPDGKNNDFEKLYKEQVTDNSKVNNTTTNNDANANDANASDNNQN